MDEQQQGIGRGLNLMVIRRMIFTMVMYLLQMQQMLGMLLQQRRAWFHQRIYNLVNNYQLLLQHHQQVQEALLPLLRVPERNIRRPNKIRCMDWWDRVVQLHFADEDWVANFRMRRQTFEVLCNILEPSLMSLPASVQQPISVRKKVAIALYQLASCAEYRVVGNQFGVHKSTVHKCLYAVVRAINALLMPTVIAMPNVVEAEEIAYMNETNYKFPMAFGAVDGTHIPILPPRNGYRDFINRKGWASLVLQCVVDNRFRFRNISCILPGSSHDARALVESQLYIHAEQIIPKASRVINGVDVPLMILGDAAYPLLPWLMKGFTGNLTAEQESFNVYLSSVRIGAEIAIGRLCSRWRSLLKRLDVSYRFVPQVVAACCTLHNFVENNKEPYIEQWREAIQEAEIVFPQPQLERARNRDNYDMALVRERLCQHMAATLPLRRSSFQPHRR